MSDDNTVKIRIPIESERGKQLGIQLATELAVAEGTISHVLKCLIQAANEAIGVVDKQHVHAALNAIQVCNQAQVMVEELREPLGHIVANTVGSKAGLEEVNRRTRVLLDAMTTRLVMVIK
jgi:hypothetical protein